MRDFFRFCFEQLTDPLGLPISPIAEYIILYILHMFVYKLAFKLVGNLYRSKIIVGRLSGSFLHWLLRLIIFVTVWTITNILIKICKFIAYHWQPLLIGLSGVLLLIIITISFYHLKLYRKHRNKAKTEKH